MTVGNFAEPTLRYCADDLNRYNQTYTGSQQTCPVGSPAESFTHDFDGNLTQDGTYNYTWDAENRLIAVQTKRTGDPVDGDKLVEFKYDYMGRRVEKTYKVYASGWQVQSGYPQRFVYEGWNPVLVLNGSNETVRKYTWGLDLSGTIHGAGGIGGLLAAVETQGTEQTNDDQRYWFMYDANGNVGQVLDATDINNITIAAKYEYDPYGNVINSTGSYAATNPIRFSTKWFDAETGLGYWGYRYYSPRLGRWLSRDPLREEGGANLYQYSANRPSISSDPLGLKFTPIEDRTPPAGATTQPEGRIVRTGTCVLTKHTTTVNIVEAVAFFVPAPGLPVHVPWLGWYRLEPKIEWEAHYWVRSTRDDDSTRHELGHVTRWQTAHGNYENGDIRPYVHRDYCPMSTALCYAKVILLHEDHRYHEGMASQHSFDWEEYVKNNTYEEYVRQFPERDPAKLLTEEIEKQKKAWNDLQAQIRVCDRLPRPW